MMYVWKSALRIIDLILFIYNQFQCHSSHLTFMAFFRYANSLYNFQIYIFSFLLDWDKVKVSLNNYSQMCNFKTFHLSQTLYLVRSHSLTITRLISFFFPWYHEKFSIECHNLSFSFEISQMISTEINHEKFKCFHENFSLFH